jgi:hypothetical protein
VTQIDFRYPRHAVIATLEEAKTFCQLMRSRHHKYLRDSPHILLRDDLVRDLDDLEPLIEQSLSVLVEDQEGA